MLKERALEYYQHKGCNCAESIIRAANDEYGLGINEEGLKAFGGFGGGMQCGSVCGAVCAGIGAISAKEIETNAHQTETLESKCNAMMSGFKEKFGSVFCTKVRKENFEKGSRCGKVVEGAAEVLESIMK
ncbi:C-GCAxxG-C-C family (seleno)protein [Christensenella intestinihominis]|uniref:C-GCAxxG-C-C family (seleno)protein n=1 Tax=Christensenella intestinihominis TaxID=1851429 RepID=UPI0008302194|nr:C-GCAxxG-C-C family (seleno)protein [Christensenella intestinihominis]